jgi:hypothetical protein
LPIGLKGNTDGSGAIQIGGSDAITIDTSLIVTMNGGGGSGAATSPNPAGGAGAPGIVIVEEFY